MNDVLIEARDGWGCLAWRDKGREGRIRRHLRCPDGAGSIMRHPIVYDLLWLPADRLAPLKPPQQDSIAIRAWRSGEFYELGERLGARLQTLSCCEANISREQITQP